MNRPTRNDEARATALQRLLSHCACKALGFVSVAACCMALLACVAAFPPAGAACAFAAVPTVVTAQGVPEAFDYDGDVERFIDADGKEFGMYRRQDGSTIALKGGKIVVDHITSNTTIYAGFYLNVNKADSSTWSEDSFIACNDQGWLTFELDPSYAGKAWPVAPVKKSDMTATTEGQYYLGIPPLAKISEAEDDEDPPADDGEELLDKARNAIAALPANPKDIPSQASDEIEAVAVKVSAACEAYEALSGELKGRLSDDELLRLSQCAIAVLPSDPFDVTTGHSALISQARSVYDSLPAGLQSELDSTTFSSSRSYGRYLENAVWALDSLKAVNNVTILKSGTYTGQVTSKSSMGKSDSPRSLTFTVTSVKVRAGRSYAVLEHSSNASGTVSLGGNLYHNLQADGEKHSYYEVPINLNSTFHFSVKGKAATADTDAISYEMTVSADVSSMQPDAADPDASNSDGGDSGGSGSDDGGSAADGAGEKHESDGGEGSSGKSGGGNGGTDGPGGGDDDGGSGDDGDDGGDDVDGDDDDDDDDDDGDDDDGEDEDGAGAADGSSSRGGGVTSSPGTTGSLSASVSSRTGSGATSGKSDEVSRSNREASSSASADGVDADGRVTATMREDDAAWDIDAEAVGMAPGVACATLVTALFGGLLFAVRFFKREALLG